MKQLVLDLGAEAAHSLASFEVGQNAEAAALMMQFASRTSREHFAYLWGAVGVAVVYGLGQVIESFFLTPRLVGERIGMSPITVIFALLAFGHLFGFVGVLLALPISALLVVAARRVQAAYLTSRLYLG